MAVSKLMTLKEAISQFVNDGDTIYYGGFQIMVPMAITHEIIRQKKKNLTTMESSTDVGGLDILVGGGCVKEIHSAWIMNWYVKAVYAVRRAFQSKMTKTVRHFEFWRHERAHGRLPRCALFAGTRQYWLRHAQV